MKVTDLNRDQLTELKQNYLVSQKEAAGEGVYYSEFGENVNDIVSDEEIEKEYANTEFSPDDFICTQGCTEPTELIFSDDELKTIYKDIIDSDIELNDEDYVRENNEDYREALEFIGHDELISEKNLSWGDETTHRQMFGELIERAVVEYWHGSDNDAPAADFLLDNYLKSVPEEKLEQLGYPYDILNEVSKDNNIEIAR